MFCINVFLSSKCFFPKILCHVQNESSVIAFPEAYFNRTCEIAATLCEGIS